MKSNVRATAIAGAIVTSFLLVTVPQAKATVIISAQTAVFTDTSGNPAGSYTDPSLMIDQSGLQTGYTSGVTDFNLYNPSTVGHSAQYGGGVADEWFSRDFSAGSVVYDLGSIYNIDRVAFWNEDAEGIASVLFSFSTDGVNYTLHNQTFSPTDNPWQDPLTPYTANVFSFSTYTAQFVKFDLVASNPADDGYPNLSIGEVAFGGDPIPEPTTILLFGCGLLGLAGIRQRKKK